MSDKLWFGCPNCCLAFYSEGEYRHHFSTEHPARKFRLAEPIALECP